jgi:hypothetical protein
LARSVLKSVPAWKNSEPRVWIGRREAVEITWAEDLGVQAQTGVLELLSRSRYSFLFSLSQIKGCLEVHPSFGRGS